MIVAIVGGFIIVLGLVIFILCHQDNVDLKPVAIMFALGIGLSLADPVFLNPIGKFIVGLPWIGGG